MEKLTIHRALAELKLIGKRIDTGINSITPTGIMRKGKKVNDVIEVEKFKKDALERFQSVQDLIKRRNAIKSAIVLANATTKVTIGDQTMTIADAINLKAVLEYKQNLIGTLRKKHNAMVTALETNNSRVEIQALKLAETALQKENVKLGDDDVMKVTAPYLEANLYELVDPIGVAEETDKMEKELLSFTTEVDAVLSEINATTFIELA